MMHVNGVCVENVVAIHRCRVDVLVKSAGIERGVVIGADGEGYSIYGWWQEAETLAHKVLGQSHLCFEAEVEATAPVTAANGHAAAPASGAWCVGVGVVVIARHCS